MPSLVKYELAFRNIGLRLEQFLHCAGGVADGSHAPVAGFLLAGTKA